MKYKELNIDGLVAKYPIVQGGMGVGISLSNLAGHVALAGGVGIISTAQIGFREEGYDENYAAAVSAGSSLLGTMVPPSITLIVYASLTECSVQKLFIATVVPAVVCTGLFIAYSLYYGKKHNLPKQPKKSAAEVRAILLDSVWALLMPVIVLGSIFSGICTVTESAAISVIYAAVIGLFVYKTITVKDLFGIVYDSAVSSSAAMVLVGFSKAAGYVVIASQLPRTVMEFMTGMTSSKVVVLICINIIFLVLGCLMEGNSIIVMMVPLMINLVQAYNIDLVQFGILTCINIYIGFITPPVGVSLLLASKIGNTSMGKTFIEMIPFTIIAVAVLILVTFVPGFSLWLPGVIG